MSRNRILLFLSFVCLLLASSISAQEILVLSALFFISALCEYVDSSLGMGYGTTLSPLLLIFGIARVELVPAILLSESVTGIFAGIAHHREGNIDIANRKVRSKILMLAVPAVAGVFAASFIGSRLNSFGQEYGNLYIGIMVISIGLYLIVFSSREGRKEVSRTKLVLLGTVGAFNKAVSGGGYGPLITGGQLTAGVKEREAVAVTSICESFTCLSALLVFFSLGGELNLYYAIPLCLGSMAGVIPAAKTVKILPQGLLKKSIGWATLLLGSIMLIKFLN